MIEINKIFRNRVRITATDAQGHVVRRTEAENTLTYAAASVLVNALLRSGPSQVTHLYCRYGNNSGSPGSGTLVLPSAGIKAVARAQFIQSTSPDQGGLWVPLLGAPEITTSNSSLYSNNVATYSFRIPAGISTSSQSPMGSFTASSAYILAIGLAVAVNISDRTQDIIIGVLNNIAPQQVPVGGQIGIDYPLTVQS